MGKELINQVEEEDFWNSEKDDLWAQRILDTNVDLDREML